MKPQKVPYQRMIFVCTNSRESGEKSCSNFGEGERLREELKRRVKEAGLKGKVRVSSAKCLDLCSQGPNIMIFPDNVWLSAVSDADLDHILQTYVLPLKA